MELGRNDWLGKLLFGRRKSVPKVNPAWPIWYRKYYEAYEAVAEDCAYGNLNLVVFDTETTGLDPKQDRMISIGALRLRNNSIFPNEVFSLFLNPSEAKQKTDAVIIHGLLPDSDQRQYHEESEVLASFLEYLGNSVMVAHHLHFDVTMVNQSLARCGAGPLLNQGVDTAHLARRLQPSGYWSPNDVYTLDAQARRYKIPLADRHTAVGDSYITAVLFMKQIQKLEEIKNWKLILEDLL